MLKSLLCCGVVVSVVVIIVVVGTVVVIIVVVVGTVVVVIIVVVVTVVVTTVVVYGVIGVVVSGFFGTSITNFNSRARVAPSITMTNRIITITAERRCHHLRVLLLRGRFSLYTWLLSMLCLTRNFKLE